jgi:hypothetical protein
MPEIAAMPKSVMHDESVWQNFIEKSMKECWEEFGERFVLLAEKYGIGFNSVKGLKGDEREETENNNTEIVRWFHEIAKLYLESIEKHTESIEPSIGQSLSTVFDHALKNHIRGGAKPPKGNTTGTLSIKFQYKVKDIVVGSLSSRQSLLGIDEDDIIMTFDKPQQLAAEDLD